MIHTYLVDINAGATVTSACVVHLHVNNCF